MKAREIVVTLVALVVIGVTSFFAYRYEQKRETAGMCPFCDRMVHPVTAYRLKVGGHVVAACCPRCGMHAQASQMQGNPGPAWATDVNTGESVAAEFATYVEGGDVQYCTHGDQPMTREANDFPSAWTADSKAVLFRSDRNGAGGIFKQAIGQDTAEPVVTGSQHNTGAGSLSADGAWILYREWPKTAGPSTPIPLMRIPVSGGVPQPVLESRNPQYLRCARAPASLCVVLEGSPDDKLLTLSAFDPLKGRGKVLTTIEKDPSHYYAEALSPDGSTFALSRTGEAEIHIRLLSLSGGSESDITVKGWPNLTGELEWSPDGKGLYCVSGSPQASTLLYVDLKGNAKPLWEKKGPVGVVWSVPSPDGHYLAIMGMVYNSNVWMLEGF